MNKYTYPFGSVVKRKRKEKETLKFELSRWATRQTAFFPAMKQHIIPHPLLSAFHKQTPASAYDRNDILGMEYRFPESPAKALIVPENSKTL